VKNTKEIRIDIPTHIHILIKTVCAKNNKFIKTFVEEAIIEKLNHEN